MSDKVAYIGCEMSVSGRVGGLEWGSGIVPEKTDHLYPKVPAVVVTNCESVNANRRMTRATMACTARVDHGILTGKCRQEREEGESTAHQGSQKGARPHGARRGVNETGCVGRP